MRLRIRWKTVGHFVLVSIMEDIILVVVIVVAVVAQIHVIVDITSVVAVKVIVAIVVTIVIVVDVHTVIVVDVHAGVVVVDVHAGVVGIGVIIVASSAPRRNTLILQIVHAIHNMLLLRCEMGILVEFSLHLVVVLS